MKLLGDLKGFQNIAAWVIAGGIALSYQYYRQKEANSGTFTKAEIEAFNAKRKEEVKGKVAEEEPSAGNKKAELR